MDNEEIEVKDVFDNSEPETIIEETTDTNTEQTDETTIDEPNTEESSDNEETENTVDEPEEINYKEKYEQLLKFKADGQDIELDSVDELISLAQKGINYTRKTKELSKYNRYIKSLKDNDLLDENKINFLIDLHKGDKTAITKHLKELKVDPIELDTESDSNYVGKNYIPDATQYQKEEFIDSIYREPEGKAVIDAINSWDDASINEVAKDVTILTHLTNHKKLGYYDIITKEIQKQELLGNLNNTTYLQAYTHIGQELMKQGKLGQQNPSPNVAKVVDVKKAVTAIKLNQSNVQKLSPLSGKTTSKQEIDPGSLNDEEFNKYMKQKYKF